MVCFGGVGSNAGSAFGGAVIMLLPESLTVFKEYKGLVYGLILVLSLRFMPGGVAGMVKGLMRLGQQKTERLQPLEQSGANGQTGST